MPASHGVNAWTQLSQRAHNFLYDKEVVFRGLERVSEERVRALLPTELSNITWLSSRGMVEGSLLSDPFIKSAEIEPCSMWGCFSVTIHERAPRYVSYLKGSPWLVSEDGAFIGRLDQVRTTEDLVKYLKVNSGLVYVDGDPAYSPSPDELRSRFLYLKSAIPVITSEVGKDVQSVSFDSSGDMVLRFSGVSFPVTFDYSGEDLSKLGRRARRLSVILSKFQGRKHLIEKVDLAFDRIGVITLVKTSS